MWFNYGSSRLAEYVYNNIKNGTYKICGCIVSAESPTSMRSPFDPTTFTVVSRNVPIEAAEADVTRSVAQSRQPHDIGLGKSANNYDERIRTVHVKTLLTCIRPLKVKRVSKVWETKTTAVAYFQDDDDTREAVRSHHIKPWDFLNRSNAFLQTLSSFRIKVSAWIHNQRIWRGDRSYGVSVHELQTFGLYCETPTTMTDTIDQNHVHTEADIQNAMLDLKNRCYTSIRSAAKAHCIPFTTLHNRMFRPNLRAISH